MTLETLPTLKRKAKLQKKKPHSQTSVLSNITSETWCTELGGCEIFDK